MCRSVACVAIGVLFLPCATGHARTTVPQVALPLMSTPPTIDGVIHEAEWAGAVRNVGFAGHTTRTITHRQGVFWVGCDGKQLYIAMKTETPPDGKILIRAVPDGKRDIIGAFKDDSLELALDPKRGRKTGSRAFYHLITNARGTLYDRAIDPDNKQNPSDYTWRMPKWTYKNQVKDGWWHIEIAIPLSSLGATADDLKLPWGIRIARNWKRPFAQSQWESVSTSYVDQPSMPIVQWDPNAPVVQVLGLHEKWQQAKISLSVRNPHDKPMQVKVYLSDAWHRNPPRESERTLTVPPGKHEVVAMTAPDGGAEGPHRTVIRVASTDGKRVYYLRDFRWSMHRPKELWSIGQEQKKAVDLQFKYYPYHNKVRVRVDISTVPMRERITGATAVIRRVGDNKKPGPPLWQQKLVFAKFQSGGVYAIPDLKDGTYELAVTLQGSKGVPADAVVQRFVRQHFEWEHNTLGISDEVMPPFTPMQVDGSVVKCVLREHTHGPDGLWRTLRSQGRDLLTGPMTWEVVAGKAKAKLTGAGWRCIGRKPTGVVGEARWSAGAVKACVRTEYDYDGMMRVTLDVEPTGSTRIDRLTLNIPVRESEARYMHAVGDGLRHNYAGFVPEGTGRVWDSSKANKIDIRGTFYPYLWVGGGERGLAWFADTDRDWVLNDDTPVLDLSRNGDTLLVRLHLITKPGVLKRRHKIVFGLQATPTKPMPKGWRRWMCSKDVPGGRPIRWMGACMYWGGWYYDVHPYQRRFEYFDEMKRLRLAGKQDFSFVEPWMKMLGKRFAKGTKHYKSMLAHTRAGLHVAGATPWSKGFRLFGYTNARGIGFHIPEFATFQDEWLRYAWYGRNWNPQGAIAYDVSPSKSFQDFAVWFYRKMLVCMDGVYWDNTYLAAHYDPVVGNAWFDDKGKVHPGLGLWHLRDLIKRTAIMHWQESKKFPANRKPLLQLSHMTNTMIVPVLSFGNCNMDWEWRYGYKDFQDRFSPDLTVAETLARQVGAWPTILGGGHPDPKDPRTAWMWRTRLGVCLVHEVQYFDYRPVSDYEFYRKLFEFGYGTDACRVHNYWDPAHPVTVKGADVRTLVMVCKGAALVVVTDYGKGGNCVLTLDLKALGLKDGVAATDFETGKPVDRTGSSTFRFPLKKHDFKIVRVN